MTHPLTDEICEEITFWRNPCDNMRAAADWQLEECVEELNGVLSLFQLSGKINEAERLSLLNVFRAAMRPQVVDLPQANSDVCGEEGIKRAQQRTFEENDELLRKLSDS